ncbi:hypothetical protein D3C85_1289940 [compost metagenome]
MASLKGFLESSLNSFLDIRLLSLLLQLYLNLIWARKYSLFWWAVKKILIISQIIFAMRRVFASPLGITFFATRTCLNAIIVNDMLRSLRSPEVSD